MKTLSILVGFLLLSSLAQAQSFTQIVTKGNAYYSSPSNEPGVLTGIAYESFTRLGNGDTIFTMRNTIRSFNGNTLLDTVGGILGKEVIKLAQPWGGWFRILTKSDDTIMLNCNLIPGEYAKFCNLELGSYIQAECTAIETDTVAGVPEEVKVFTLQAKDAWGLNINHFYSGKQIRIGKHFGFVETYDWYNFPLSTPLYTLAGRNYPEVGYQGLTWKDIYDFSIGDEFHYKQILPRDPVTSHVTIDETRVIKKVLSKSTSINHNTVTYSFAQCALTKTTSFFSGISYSFSSDTIQETYSYDSSLNSSSINWFPEQFNGNGNKYLVSQYHIIPGRPANASIDSFYTCCWYLPTYPLAMMIQNEQEFTKGLGLVHYKNYLFGNDPFYSETNDLVYYRKGTETWGNPVAIDCAELQPHFTATPDTLVLTYLSGSSDTLHITANVPWSIVNTGTIEVTYTPESGTHDADVMFTATTQNDTENDKFYEVGLETSLGNETVTIKQLAKPSALNTFSLNLFTIQPNPVKTNCWIELQTSSISTYLIIEVFDLLGNRVYRDRFDGARYRFERGSLKSGVYFIQIRTEKDEVLDTHKLFLE